MSLNSLKKEPFESSLSAKDYNSGKSARNVGEIFKTSDGSYCKVLGRESTRKVLITFIGENGGAEAFVGADKLKSGSVKNPLAPSVFGVGYLGLSGRGKLTDKAAYVTWKSMIQRGYSSAYLRSRPTYRGVTVCDEWKDFSCFAEWYENADNAGRAGFELDKDITSPGERQYNPNTASFIPYEINSLFVGCSRRVSGAGLPAGVYRNRKGYKALISRYGNYEYLGAFKTAEEAFLEYKSAREEYVLNVAKEHANDLKDKTLNSLLSFKQHKHHIELAGVKIPCTAWIGGVA